MELTVRLQIVGGVILAAWVLAAAARRYFARSGFPRYFDRRDAGLDARMPALVQFSTRYCYECQVALPVLNEASVEHGMPLAVIDARDRPDLALKYSIRTTPTILLVDQRGKVTKGWLTTPPRAELGSAAAAVTALSAA